MTVLYLLLFVLLGAAAAGPALRGVKAVWLRRCLGWTIVLAVVSSAHLVLVEASPIVRMAGICWVLLTGMKGLVYAEWAGRFQLPLLRYIVFCFLWLGMDPASFRKRRPRLTWKGDVCLGVLLTIIGASLAWLVWRVEWQLLVAVFLPMSLCFHFGVLRVLKGVLRASGFPVIPTFNFFC